VSVDDSRHYVNCFALDEAAFALARRVDAVGDEDVGPTVTCVKVTEPETPRDNATGFVTESC
jgi:hypothetical protein